MKGISGESSNDRVLGVSMSRWPSTCNIMSAYLGCVIAIVCGQLCIEISNGMLGRSPFMPYCPPQGCPLPLDDVVS